MTSLASYGVMHWQSPLEQAPAAEPPSPGVIGGMVTATILAISWCLCSL